MFFKYLNYRQSKKIVVLDKSYGRDPTRTKKATATNVSPPPPYGELFNRNRFMTGSDLFYGQNPSQFSPESTTEDNNSNNASSMKNRKVINGRDYMVVREQGMSRLVPMRVPSAALFQYSYTN